ncbi:putative porin [Flavobacteriaceae bacterium]|nr:putative porin [Flavobacteriaceae bacterium]
MNRVVLLLGLLWGGMVMAQSDTPLKAVNLKGAPKNLNFSDSIVERFKERARMPLTPITDYLIISNRRDTTSLDTTLTMQLAHRFNTARRDLFGRIPFSNIGRPMGELIKEVSNQQPFLGNSLLSYMIDEKDEISFYRTPTPLTELKFLTTHNRGQQADVFLATNLSPEFNIMIGYRGHRSEGHYAFEEVEFGSFRTSFNYTSKDKRYQLLGFYTYHDGQQQENGGLLFSTSQFESGDPQFADRKLIDTRLSDMNHRIVQRAYYINQRYKITEQLYALQESHYDSRYFQMNQTSATIDFGEMLMSGAIDDKHAVNGTDLSGGLEFRNKSISALSTRLRYLKTGQYLKDTILGEELTQNRSAIYKDLRVEGILNSNWGSVDLRSEVGVPLKQETQGLYLDAVVKVALDSTVSLKAGLNRSERLPSLNRVRYASNYQPFHWSRRNTQPLVKFNSLYASLETDWWGSLTAGFDRIDNYTYFAAINKEGILSSDETLVRPHVIDSPVEIKYIEYQGALHYNKWTLDLRARIQESGATESYYNIPKTILRSTLYYSTDLFEKAMFAQIGVKAHYFDAFYADAYHPVLGEFYVQNEKMIGGYPLVDAFINAKVRTMRLFLTYQHVNSSVSNNDYFAAPNYPYRDGVVRFGFVWNFFD